MQAAVDAAAEHTAPTDEPLVLTGWSFGADMTLATVDARLAAWMAIAPRCGSAPTSVEVAHDARPKLLVLGRARRVPRPASVVDATDDWTATEIDVIAGASHFFVGRTDRVVDAVRAFVEEVVG